MLSGVESELESGLALITWHQRQVNLLGDELEAAINLVLAPPRHVTPDPGTIAEDVVKLVVTGWKTSGVDVGMVDVDVSVSVEDGDVVAESGGAHAGVLEDPDHGVLLVSLLLWSIETRGIPLSYSHLQQTKQDELVTVDVLHQHLLSLRDVLQLVSSSEHLPGGGVVVVVGVVSDDGAGANEVIVLVEEDAGPGELSW